eukprot:9500758-Pyramimonas_sp.AAC.1
MPKPPQARAGGCQTRSKPFWAAHLSCFLTARPSPPGMLFAIQKDCTHYEDATTAVAPLRARVHDQRVVTHEPPRPAPLA